MLSKDMILSIKDLVSLFGTEKQKVSYMKNHKLKSNSKRSILSQAATYCKLEEYKEGRELRFKVIEVYECQIQKVENRGGSKARMREELTTQLLYALYNSESNTVTASFVTVAEMLNMINEDWKVGRNNISKTSEYLEIDSSVLYDFFDKTQTGFKYFIESALDHLKKKALITWDKNSYKVCKLVSCVRKNKLGEPIIERGQLKYTINRVWEEATKEEMEFLLEVKTRVLDGSSYNQYFASYGRNKFREECNKIIRSESNILYYIPLYTIRLTRVGIKREIDRIELELAGLSTNEKCVQTSLAYGNSIAKSEYGFEAVNENVKKQTNRLTHYFISKDGALGLNKILMDIRIKS